MGALTLKSFPFELRGWDIEKLESIDPTDGFGSDTRVYVSKNQIIQIEPDFNINSSGTWLTDKGRQFFDGIFGTWSPNNEKKLNTLELSNKEWYDIVKNIVQTVYMFEHCKAKISTRNFFTIVFENLSIEMLSLLTIISQNQPFIKLRRIENIKANNDLETDFQLNSAATQSKLSSSTLCLLLSNNPRYEGYHLNLNLRQRMLKGNFKCLIVGSLIDLTFPVSFLGSNFNILKTIAEGNNLICQEFKYANNPLVVITNELFKRTDGENSMKMLKSLKYANLFSKSWNGINTLNPSLSESGTQSINRFVPLNSKDLNNFSSLYLLNITTNNTPNLKKMTELKLLNKTSIKNSIKSLFIDQNNKSNTNLSICNEIDNILENKFQKYMHLPSSMFYENEETFINTEGFIKRTNKLILKKKTKNNWQILRRVFKHLKSHSLTLNIKDSQLLAFNSTKTIAFKNYVHFHYQATQTLTNVNFYLNIKNENFSLFSNTLNFKQNRIKLKNTKLKYWLDDFFNGGKDEYSQHSLILSNCSQILRSKTTNFF
jgi:NADH dehydrogenase/NADH:ubiquinone oxidoreductase subunit G